MAGYEFYKTFAGEDQDPGRSRTTDHNRWAKFIAAVRTRGQVAVIGPIEERHISSAHLHLANASYRFGRRLNSDPATEQVIGEEEANCLLCGTNREPHVVLEEV